MPSVQEACCDSKEDCLNDVKSDFPPIKLVVGTPGLILSTVKCLGMSAEDAKSNVIESAKCNFWCSVMLGIVSFVLLMIYEVPIMTAIQNLVITIIMAFLSLWILRCCLALDDKCWWLVNVIFTGINLAQLVLAGIGILSYSAITAIVYLLMALPVYLMFVYALRYYMINEFGGAAAGGGKAADGSADAAV